MNKDNNFARLTIIILMLLFLNINQIYANELSKENKITISIIYVGGSGDNNYTSIQDAINNSNDNDIIYVYNYSSPYNENIVIYKSVTLMGEDKENTVINGGKNGTTIEIIKNNVIVKNFKIISNKDIYFSSGIELTNSDNVEISNNLIINNYDGIIINNSNHNNIIDNLIQNNGRTGVLIQHSNNNIIENNNISNNKVFGIFYFYANYNKILKNKILGNGDDGMVFRNSENNEVYSNNISGSYYYGVNLFSTENKNNIFYYNNFYKNGFNARGENNNQWDNGFKGNYWDDYGEKYPNASKKIRGIWNTPYEINGIGNYDRYPLVSLYNPDIINEKLNIIKIIEEMFYKFFFFQLIQNIV